MGLTGNIAVNLAGLANLATGGTADQDWENLTDWIISLFVIMPFGENTINNNEKIIKKKSEDKSELQIEKKDNRRRDKIIIYSVVIGLVIISYFSMEYWFRGEKQDILIK